MNPSEIVFEQPVNERVRTMLRLEHLFAQLNHHRQDHSEWGVRACISALIDILSLFSRNDLKTEINRELKDKHSSLLPLRDRPGVNRELLDQTLQELQATAEGIQDLSSQQISQSLKHSDFLLAIINRSAIPGGTSGIDLPRFHHWLQLDDSARQADLGRWLEPIAIFEQASSLYMRLLRQSSAWQEIQTEDGLYVHTSKDKYDLIRIALPAASGLYPEISAGRKRFTVRLLLQQGAMDKEQAPGDAASFKISLCTL